MVEIFCIICRDMWWCYLWYCYLYWWYDSLFCDQASVCGSNLNWLLNLNMIYKTLWTGARSGLLISILGKLNWFCLTGLITPVVLLDGSVLEEKSSFKMLGLTSSSKLDWGFYIISIAKTNSKKIRGSKSLNSFYEVSFSWACSVSL